jgi:hypothetical protein
MNASALLKDKLTGIDQGELLMLWGVSEGMTTFAMVLWVENPCSHEQNEGHRTERNALSSTESYKGIGLRKSYKVDAGTGTHEFWTCVAVHK